MKFNIIKNNERFVFFKRKTNNFFDSPGCFVPEKYISSYGLSFTEAGLYSILCGLSSKDGYCFPSNEFISKRLAITPRTISNYLKRLTDKKLIYVHIYITRNGKRREITTRTSLNKYKFYLRSRLRFAQLGKLKKEFSQYITKPAEK